MDKTLPYSRDAERAVLGSILLDGASLGEVLEVLAKEDFFLPAHRIVFEQILKLSESNTIIDLVTLCEVLSTQGQLEKAGGAGYIAALTDGVPVGSTGVSEYARIVREKSQSRALIRIAQESISMATSGYAISAVRDFMVGETVAIESDRSGREEASYRDAALSLLRNLEKGDLPRILTGIELVDSSTGGFQPGELVVYSAATGVGKTLLAQQTRQKACRDGLNSIFASAEMSKEQLVARELPAKAGVPRWKMRQPAQLTRPEFSALLQAASHECPRCRILDGAITMGRVIAAAQRFRTHDPLHLVVIDYDELVVSPGRTEHEQQIAVALAAKRLALSLSLVVILVSQMRKPAGAGPGNPSLDALYGSGAKSKHASTVIYAERTYVANLIGDETAAKIYILKSRDGQVGRADALFNIKTLRFENPVTEANQP